MVVSDRKPICKKLTNLYSFMRHIHRCDAMLVGTRVAPSNATDGRGDLVDVPGAGSGCGSVPHNPFISPGRRVRVNAFPDVKKK